MILVGLAALIAAGFGIRAAAAAEPTGWWLDQSGRAGILIAPCGDKLCGTIRWLAEPLDPATGGPKLDRKNSNGAERGRPLCGLKMLGDFVKAEDPGEWTDGWIYNPEDGQTYRSQMTLERDGTLRVRGYVGIPLLGKSQIWSRPRETPAECEVPRR
jgi:uncharacterized protein (DUF2147 family)